MDNSEDRRQKSVGAVWEKVAKSGKVYLSISIGDTRYVAFRYTSENPKAPNFRIYESNPAYEKPVEKKEEVLPFISDDEVPF